MGLALAAAVFSNVLQSRFPTALSEQYRLTITGSIFRVPDLHTLPASKRDGVLSAYMSASRAVFIMWVPFIALCLSSCIFVKDRGLKRPDEVEDDVMVIGVAEK